MGPDMQKRFEEFHGLDEHPNGVPPEPEDPGLLEYIVEGFKSLFRNLFT